MLLSEFLMTIYSCIKIVKVFSHTHTKETQTYLIWGKMQVRQVEMRVPLNPPSGLQPTLCKFTKAGARFQVATYGSTVMTTSHGRCQ